MRAGDPLLRLARPSTPAEWRRWWLVVVAGGGAGGLLLGAARIARYGGPDGSWADDGGLMTWPGSGDGYAPYVEDPGTRYGVVVAGVLLCVPLLVLGVQALRVGSAARLRRLVTLRAAGASLRQLRRLSGVETGRAGLAAGVGAVAVYLVLSVGGRAVSRDIRLVPLPDRWDVLACPVVVAVVALVAWWGGRVTVREVPAGVERVRSRSPRAVRRTRYLLAALAAGAALLFGWASMSNTAPDNLRPVSTGPAIAGLVLAGVLAAPALVLLTARRLERSGDVRRVLAAARLRFDPVTPGHVVAVVVVCGLALMISGAMIVAMVAGHYWCSGCDAAPDDVRLSLFDDVGFYLVGSGLAGVAAVLAMIVAGMSAVVGTAEQILDGRRAMAALAAFGVGTAQLTRVLRLQVTGPALLAVTAETVLGVALFAVFAGNAAAVLGALLGGVVAMVAVTGFGALATWVLRPQVREAAAVVNLRTT